MSTSIETLITDLMKTEKGWEKIAASFTQPLRLYRDIMSIPRQLLTNQNPLHYILTEEEILKKDPSPPPLLPYEVTVIVAGGYAGFESAQDTLRERVLRFEMGAFLKLLQGSAEAGDLVDFPTRRAFEESIQDRIQALFKRHENNPIKAILLNGREFATIRKHCSDDLELVKHTSQVKTGLMGELYGAKFYCSRYVPVGSLYFLPSQEHLGVYHSPIEEDITVTHVAPNVFRVQGSLGMAITAPRNITLFHITG